MCLPFKATDKKILLLLYKLSFTCSALCSLSSLRNHPVSLMDAIPMLSHYAFGTPSDADVREVAKQTVAILRGYGLSCCFVGSVASVLWGASRTPNASVRAP